MKADKYSQFDFDSLELEIQFNQGSILLRSITERNFSGIACCVIIIACCSSGSLNAQSNYQLPDSLPALPNALDAPLDWMDSLKPPFHVMSFLTGPSARKNGATYYLMAMAECSSAMSVCFANKDQDFLQQSGRKQEIIERLYGDFAIATRFKNIAEIQSAMGGMLPAFVRVEAAQEQSVTVFQTDQVNPSPHLDAAVLIAKAFVLKTVVDVKEARTDVAVENVGQMLRLSRDLIPRGGLDAANAALKIEDMVCRQMIPVIFMEKHNTRPNYCDTIMTMLTEHRDQRRKISTNVLASDWMRCQIGVRSMDLEDEQVEQFNDDLKKWFHAVYDGLDRPNSEKYSVLEKAHSEFSNKYQTKGSFTKFHELAQLISVFDTQIDLSIGLCALRKQYMTSREIPSSLKQIFATAPFPKVPLDNMRSNEFKEDPIKAKFFKTYGRIYSVGADGKDDDALTDSDMVIHIEPTGLIEMRYDPYNEYQKLSGSSDE